MRPDNSATSKIPTITSTENGLLDVWFAVVSVWQLVLWRLVKRSSAAKSTVPPVHHSIDAPSAVATMNDSVNTH